MTDTTATSTGETFLPTEGVLPFVSSGSASFQPDRVSRLLVGLRDAAIASQPIEHDDFKHENHLALVRLGVATSLFFALRVKHAPTASHSLRVALACSAWAERLGLDERDRDRIEVAALLHDIGKIGIPDRILRKPGKLTVDEQLLMDSCGDSGCEILRGCSADADLLDMIRYSSVWYNSRRFGESLRGDALPLGARILSIANAFDSMTTEHVYRRALSRERAIKQLLDGGGTQFDPELASDYSHLVGQSPEALQASVIHRWLQQLRPEAASEFWSTTSGDDATQATQGQPSNRLYYQQLLSQMHDGVAFTDNQATILDWNTALEQMTGITRDAAIGTSWNGPSLRLTAEAGSTESADCLVQLCLRTHSIQSCTMLVESLSGVKIPVAVRVSPVVGSVPGAFGTIIVVRDLSDQTSLQRRLESLHQQVTRDALTGIANRAEFDRRILELTTNASAGGATFSLIICDIDHFKRVNDVHGHPAGDEALVKFASLLSGFSREGDLVARYGGEEFVFLAAACNNSTAAARAELIRQALEQTPLPSLGNASVTASFGVTEFQAGDSAETILARADRALLRAKDSGRNRVIQLGSGAQKIEASSSRRNWLSWFDASDRRPDREVDILTPVPIDLAIEKLKGFIADHDADILCVTENQVSLRVTGTCSVGGRRRVDHQITFNALLTLSEAKQDTKNHGRGWSNTKVHVLLKPIRNRDRRRGELRLCSDKVVASLKSYLIGEIVEEFAE